MIELPETPTLVGHLVRLEPLTMEHLPALEEVAFDERIWRYMLVNVKTSDDLRSWMEAALKLRDAGSSLPWVTVLEGSGKVVGSTRFLDMDLRNETVEIGHTWLSPEFQGTGVNAEAKMLQLSYAFNVLGLRRVAFKTHHENFQSQAAMRRLGLVEEGTFRNHYIMPDGSQRHSVWFSVTREDWPAMRSTLRERLVAAPRRSA